MKLKNNRRLKYDFIFGNIFSLCIVVFFYFLNYINNNPEEGFILHAPMIAIMIFPNLVSLIYYNMDSKTIVIEEEGVAEYKKGKLVKLIKYQDITQIDVQRQTITVFGTIKPDFPYLHIITSFSLSLIKLFTSKDFRKRRKEFRIDFANTKRGFDEIELPFITEIAKRSEREINWMWTWEWSWRKKKK